MTAAPVSRAAAPDNRRPAPVALVAIVLVVAFVSLYGAELAVGTFRAGDAVPTAPSVGVPLGTTFGSVTVEHAQVIDGLTSRAMWNGMTHGIQGLVQPDEAQVAIAVYLTNDGDRPTPIDAGQFRLLVEGRADAALPTGGTVLPLRLQPGAGVRGTLVFVVPLGEARTSVVYQDPGGDAVTIPVGQLGEAPPPEPGHPAATDHLK